MEPRRAAAGRRRRLDDAGTSHRPLRPPAAPRGLKPSAIAVAAALALAAGPLGAQPWPLRVEAPPLVEAGAVAARVGLEVGSGVEYPASGLSGTAVRTPAAVRFGLGRAELSVEGGYEFLSIDDFAPAPLDSMLDVSGDGTHDVIDPVIGMKVRIADESPAFPAWSFRITTRLPAAGNESGLGLDTTDFWLWLLAGKSIGRARIAANLGAGVLGIPTRGDRQNDVWGYGLSFVAPLGAGWDAAAEVQGSLDARGDTPVGTEERGEARVGLRRAGGPFTIDGVLIVGLHDPDPDLGAAIGVSATFHGAFGP